MIRLLQNAPGAVLHGGRRTVLSVAFAPHAQELAIGDAGGTVRLWDTATLGELGKPLETHQGTIWQLAFSPSGRILATAGDDGTVRLWHVGVPFATGQTLEGPQAVDSLAFNTSGTMIAAGYANGLVAVWRLHGATAADRKLLPGRVTSSQALAVTGLAFSPDGTTIAAARSDGEVQLWRGGSHMAQEPPLRACTCALHALAFSPDGKTLAAAGNGVFLWNLGQVSMPGRPRLLPGSRGIAWDLAFSPDGRRLAAGLDGRAMLWPVARDLPQGAGESLTGDAGVVLAVAFSPGGGTLASAGEGGAVLLWGTRHPLVVRRLGDSSPQVTELAFAPGCCSGLYAADNGEAMGGWNLPGDAGLLTPAQMNVQAWGIAASPTGHVVAVASGFDGQLRLFETRSGRLAMPGQPVVTESQISSIAFSPNGHELAAGADSVELWMVTSSSGRPELVAPHPLPGSNGTGSNRAVMSVAFGRDAIAAGYADGSLRVWNAAGTRRTALIRYTKPVSVAFSPDGRWLAVACTDGTVHLLNASAPRQPGRVLHVLATKEAVNAVAFSPDSQTLATADYYGNVELWDVATLSQLGATLPAEKGANPLSAVAFSSDGKTIAAGGANGTTVWQGLLWDSRSDLIARVCSLVAGRLSRSEWATLAPGLAYREPCPS